jgi:DnaJ-class molecular chaperone
MRYYELFGINKNASPEEVKYSIRKWPSNVILINVRAIRPPEKIRQLSKADNRLKGWKKRAPHDGYGHDTFDPKGGGDHSGNSGGRVHDLFDIFRKEFAESGSGFS